MERHQIGLMISAAIVLIGMAAYCFIIDYQARAEESKWKDKRGN